MVSIHDRPLESLERQVARQWEGDLLKGARNASAVGTLVERKSRFLLLAKVDGLDAEAVLEEFTRRMRTSAAARGWRMNRCNKEPSQRVQVPIEQLNAIVERTRSALPVDEHATLQGGWTPWHV
jgi:IS30 family transposase